MIMTPFDPQQKEISDEVHLKYRNVLYPSLFGVNPEDITYDDLPEEFMKAADGYIAVDSFLNVKFKGLSNAMRFLISYRFREDKYQKHQDVTFTEYNHASNLPGELYKMAVHYFTYGYYDSSHHLVEAVIVDIPELKKAIAQREIHTLDEDVPNFRSRQSFVSYSFDDLNRMNFIVRHFKVKNGILTRTRQYKRPAGQLYDQTQTPTTTGAA